MSNWKNTLLSEAREKGMCGDYLEPLSLCSDKITAIGLYMSEPKWALTHDYPTLQELREHFALYGAEGLYVDHTFDGDRLDRLMCYVLHNCKGEIRTGLNVEAAVIPDIHIAHGCDLKIISEGPSIQIDIHVYGEDNVIQTFGDSTFKIHRHDTN
jgi:hypothetical protein